MMKKGGKNLRIIAVVFVLALLPATVCGQDWNSALTEGLTTLTASQSGNTLTLDIYNASSDLGLGYVGLLWDVEFFNLPGYTSGTTQNGYACVGETLNFLAPPEKYYAPPAIGPGGHLVASYILDPTAPILNSEPSLGGKIGALVHFAAAEPPALGEVRWMPITVQVDGSWVSTWQDRSISISELPTIALAIMGLISVSGYRWRRQS